MHLEEPVSAREAPQSGRPGESRKDEEWPNGTSRCGLSRDRPQGLRGLRINEVAADAGVAESLIYHHFKSRATLLRAALEYAGQQADTYTQVGEDLNGRDRLIATLLAEIQDRAGDTREQYCLG